MAVRPLVLLPPVLFAALAGMFYFGMYRENPDELPSQFIGASAPEVSTEALPGIPGVNIEALKSGDVRLVNFWASWCPPCRAEHPRLLALQAEGIDIAGVNMRDDSDDALAFLQELEASYQREITSFWMKAVGLSISNPVQLGMPNRQCLRITLPCW